MILLYREMRRKDRQITNDSALKILKYGEYGFLSMVDKDNTPYGIPISYVLDDHSIYLHSCVEGQKIDCILNNPKVTFCVVGNTEVLPDKFSTKYESVIVFGKAFIVENIDEIRQYMNILREKYSKDFSVEGRKYIERAINNFKCIKIEIEYITGKASK